MGAVDREKLLTKLKLETVFNIFNVSKDGNITTKELKNKLNNN